MPRGKLNEASKQSKLQNALTTRLIQISLKTDDHIYYGKHISPAAAKKYLQEITRLKQECNPTNVQALQVIGKLTMLMKTIIAEDQDMHVIHSLNQIIQTDTGYLRTSSPVYSLPDEDSLLEENFTDIPVIDISHDANDINAKEKIIENVYNAISNIAIQDEFVIETQAMIDHTDFTVIPIIDITEDSDVITATQQENARENVNNAIPNIIQDEFIMESQAMFDDDDCSQSILENFHDNTSRNEKNLEIENNVNASAAKVNFVAQTLNEISINSNSVRTKAVVEHPQCIVIEPQTNATDLESDAACKPIATGIVGNITLCNSLTGIPTPNKNNNACNLKTLETQPAQTFVQPQNILQQYDGNIATVRTERTISDCITNKVQETEPHTKEKKISRRNQNKGNKEVKPKRKQKSKVKVGSETAEVMIQPKSTHKGKPKRIGYEGHGKKPNLNKPVSEIYNSNVENDLSWVENLRFVREVSPEENDPALTIAEDNFWDTFSLPNNWNDLDFDY